MYAPSVIKGWIQTWPIIKEEVCCWRPGCWSPICNHTEQVLCNVRFKRHKTLQELTVVCCNKQKLLNYFVNNTVIQLIHFCNRSLTRYDIAPYLYQWWKKNGRETHYLETLPIFPRPRKSEKPTSTVIMRDLNGIRVSSLKGPSSGWVAPCKHHQ